MFILFELKDIPSGESLVRKITFMSNIGIIISFLVKLGLFKKRLRSSSFSRF